MGLRLIFILLGLGVPLPAQAEADIAAAWRKVKGATTADRVDSASRSFLGVPYADAPLGEGGADAYDHGPLYRFDAFDCTTYVETVLALAGSRKAEEFLPKLNRIRYRGAKPRFVTRNHFPCVDWIPHNTQTGVVRDITEEVGAKWGTERATAAIHKRGWFEKLGDGVIRVPDADEARRAKLLNQLHAEGKAFSPQSPSLPFIPLAKFITRNEVAAEETHRRQLEETELARVKREEAGRRPQAEDELEKEIHDALIDLRLRYLIQDAQVDPTLLTAIPNGTILNVVRPGWKIAGTLMNISHQGFVIQKKEGTYFRHVSRTGGRAKDVPLANYLRLCLLIPAIKGINLLQPL